MIICITPYLVFSDRFPHMASSTRRLTFDDQGMTPRAPNRLSLPSRFQAGSGVAGRCVKFLEFIRICIFYLKGIKLEVDQSVAIIYSAMANPKRPSLCTFYFRVDSPPQSSSILPFCRKAHPSHALSVLMFLSPLSPPLPPFFFAIGPIFPIPP